MHNNNAMWMKNIALNNIKTSNNAFNEHHQGRSFGFRREVRIWSISKIPQRHVWNIEIFRFELDQLLPIRKQENNYENTMRAGKRKSVNKY